MIDFIKQIFASAIGFLLVFVVFFFFLFILFVSASSDPEPSVRDNSVLYIKASGLIPERTSNDPFEELLSGLHPASTSLQAFDRNLRKAASDDRIDGILLEVDMLQTSWPVLQHMRRAITQFREDSGKFVFATTNDLGLNEQGYYLATAADSIFAPGNSLMLMDGFVIEGVFFENSLSKLGVNVQVVNRGAYKSAGDSFQRTSFTDEDREQLTAIFETIVDEFEDAVAKRTGMSREELTEMLNQPPRLDIEYYAERGLIDEIITRSELEKRIKARTGIRESQSVRFINNRTYSGVSERSAGLPRPAREAIAVIYADGPIMPSTGSASPLSTDNTISATSFRRSLDRALNDSNVKAIVVRINSPGGAASTSDAIWEMLQEAREKKPVIASMANVAASGGYYIAMGADEIVADRTTITGSIGVIGLNADASELLTDKMGLEFDEIRFHRNANWLSANKPMTNDQLQAFNQFIDIAYKAFVNRVAESRNMTFDEIDAIAQGRVWSGQDALEIGLVDHLGGLETALRVAAERADLQEYSIRELPAIPGLLERLLSSPQAMVQSFAKSNIPAYEEINTMKMMISEPSRPQVWAMMPYFIEVR
ncbi:MAG: signal peptide peptidase SppA [Balneolales bacterium]|nr:signal peptide peptidase SppA [Balneolales bacterium]